MRILSVNGAGPHVPKALGQFSSFILLLLVALSYVTTARATASFGNLHHLVALQARQSGNSSPNTTLLETAKISLLAGQRASWEQGVAQSAILESEAGEWSVFASRSGELGPPYSATGQGNSNRPSMSMGFLSMAFHAVGAQDSNGKLASSVTGDEDAEGGSAADPASCGEGVLIAAYMAGETIDSTESSGFWSAAALAQLNNLLDETPRTPNGALSHRSGSVAMWSDAMYMTPPFLASYGLFSNNQTLLQMAYDEIRLYREEMLYTRGNGRGLWGHILNFRNGTRESWMDPATWATGAGWITGGMLRVLATIAQSSFSSDMQNQKQDLVDWTSEILDAAYPFIDEDAYLFYNDINSTGRNRFLDAAGSLMIAYSTFRLASMAPDAAPAGMSTSLAMAEQLYQTVQTNLLSPVGNFSVPVVDALAFTVQGTTSSPESLAFAILLESARRDYYAGNVTGLDGPGTGKSGSSSAASVSGAAGLHGSPIDARAGGLIALTASLLIVGLGLL